VSTEQEYDAQTDMVDDQDTAESGPGPYPEPIPPNQHQLNQQLPNQQIPNQQQPLGRQGQMGENGQIYNSITQMLDPYDPMLDMDPFGLSASMQFPNSFSFDTSSMRWSIWYPGQGGELGVDCIAWEGRTVAYDGSFCIAFLWCWTLERVWGFVFGRWEETDVVSMVTWWGRPMQAPDLISAWSSLFNVFWAQKSDILVIILYYSNIIASC